ncbi:hypothetical protein ACEWY4_003495 [Coilia grayii]|uniref:FHA domain-containing protein n=1 Tax=Coilia grayii TaxID=363190 RepID=A0ABD1KRF6_9TELE
MPLHGKIVVIRRGGGDGTEYPLTAPCLFGRKIECDIRIQMPQVSKEHCRIEINENKEVILTNLSSVNATCINGVAMTQSERLKHGDVFTIIDRSFRFEAPPPPTPKKKRTSTSGKAETLQVLQEQQTTDKKSILASDSCLEDESKAGSDQSAEEGKETSQVAIEAANPAKDVQSPFAELFHMVKQDLDPKSPFKVFGGKTPVSRRNSQKPLTPKGLREAVAAVPAEVKGTPKKTKDAQPASPAGKGDASVATTPKSSQKKRRSSVGQPQAKPEPAPVDDVVCASGEKMAVDETTQQVVATATVSTPGNKRRSSSSSSSSSLQSLRSPRRSEPSEPTSLPSQKETVQTPQRLSAEEVAQQILADPPSAETPTKAPKSPKRRSSSAVSVTSPKPQTPSTESQPAPAEGSQEVKQSPRTSPRANAGQRFKVQDVLREMELSTPPAGKDAQGSSSKKRKSGGADPDLPTPLPKKKRVSFGGQLSPELFDKRLPPDSPLRRGATPRRRSLGLSLAHTPKSLLRRASTIGLVQTLKLGKAIPESPKAKASPGKTAAAASPAKKSPKAKTPSPKAKTASPKKPASATPSPKRQSPAKQKSPAKADPLTPKAKRSPSPAKAQAKSPAKSPAGKASPAKSPAAKAQAKSPAKSPAAKPKTPSPSPSRRASSPATSKTPSPGGRSLSETPTMTGRFSVSRISTPSPEGGKEVQPATPAEKGRATPKIPLKRKSMKASVKKNPRRSLGKGALEVIRRLSGASRANLKVVSSYADIVKFGKTKSQTLGPAKKAGTKAKVVKRAIAPKPKTPARKLKDHTSTGHANSPATIVLSRAQSRAAQVTCGAPTLVPNVALYRMDMRMNEDLTGLSDIFKTPANNKQRRASTRKSLIPETPVASTSMAVPKTPVASTSMAELSVMKTPEETGEMMVSPLSVASTAKRGGYNSEAVTRLLQDGSFIAEDDTSFVATEGASTQQASSEDDEAPDAPMAQTPEQKPAPATATCLTGVKRIMKTPKQKGEPVEDLRGRLLRTPRQKAEPVEDLTGVQRIMKTPRVRSDSPVLCTVALKRLVRTPKQPKAAEPAEEDLSGLQHLLKTPRQKGEPVEDLVGVKRLLRTPEEKAESVEDLTGVKELMKTPKTKGEAVQTKFGIRKLMKTPRQKGAAAVEDFEGLQDLLQEPEDPEMQITQPTEEETVQIQEEVTSATEVLPESSEELDISAEEDKENVCPVAIQSPDAKPCEPAATEGKREPQAKRLSSPLKEIFQDRAAEACEEPAEAECVPLETTEAPKEAHQASSAANLTEERAPEATEEPEKICLEPAEVASSEPAEVASSKPAEATTAGDAAKDLPEPVPKEVPTPARGKGRRLAGVSASTAQASPARAVRAGRAPRPLQEEEEKPTPRRGRKPKQPPAAQQAEEQMSEVVVAATSEPVGSNPGAAATAAEEVKPQEAEVTEPREGEIVEEAVNIAECASESSGEPMSADLPAASAVAETSQDLPEATAQEEPAPARGRRGRAAKQLPETAELAKPRRGRKAKQDSTEQAEEQAMEVVVAAASAPECTTESSALTVASDKDQEIVSAVEDISAESTEPASADEKNTSQVDLPSSADEVPQEEAIEASGEPVEAEVAPVQAADVPPAVSSQDLPDTTTQEEPAPARGRRGRAAKQLAETAEVAKPRRDRKAKQDSTEQAEEQAVDVVVAAASAPECTTESSDATVSAEYKDQEIVSAVEDISAESTEPASADEKNTPQIDLPSSADEVPQEEAIEASGEPVEAEVTPVQAADVPPAVSSQDLPDATTQEEPAPARGRRGRAAKQLPETTEVAKPRRGRKAKQDSTEQAEEQAVDVVVVASAAEPVETPATGEVAETPATQEESAVAEAPKAARGRRGRQTKAPVVSVPAVEPEVENNAPVPHVEERSEAAAEAASESEPSVELSEPAAVAVIEEAGSAAVAKAGRGRRGRQAAAKVQEEAKADEKPQVPAAKAGRGRKGKQASVETPEEVEARSDGQPEADQTPPPSEESEEKPKVKVARGRKGKQASVELEETPKEVVNTTGEVTGAVAAEVVEEPPQRVAKSGRGKKAKQVSFEEPEVVEESKVSAEPAVVAEESALVAGVEEPAKPTAVKVVRGRRGKQTSAKVQEQEEEETKQNEPKADVKKIPEDAEDTPQAPVAKTGRGRRAKEVEVEAEAQPDQTPITEESEKPQTQAVKSARGRKTKPASTPAPESEAMPDAEPAAPAEVAREQPQVLTVKSGRSRRAKATPSPVEAEAVESAEPAVVPEEPVGEAAVKRSRGRVIRKGKAVEKEPSIDQADEPETESSVDKEDHDMISKKSVNWSADLTQTHAFASDKSQTKVEPKRKRGSAPAASDGPEEVTAVEVKRVPKGKAAPKGRGAKKTTEPAAEEDTKPEEAAEAEPVAKTTGRRGKMAATEPAAEEKDAKPEAEAEAVAKTTGRRGKVAKTQEGKEAAPAPKRGAKRREVAEETEEPVADTASPPKRKRGTAAAPEEPRATAAPPAAGKGRRGAAKKAEEAEPEVVSEKGEPLKAAPKTIRGKRKAPQEPETAQEHESVPAEDATKAEGSISRGRGRNQRKAAEAPAAPEEAAPSRRTRRK